MVKNSQANAILECMHQVLEQMLCTAQIDMTKSATPMTSMSSLTMRHRQFSLPIIQYLKPCQVQPFLDKTCSLTFCLWLTGTKLENTGNHWGNQHKNNWRIDYDYKVGDKVLVENKGILRKAESKYGKEPWTITTIHTNGIIRIQCGTKTERLNIWRVIPFADEIDL